MDLKRPINSCKRIAYLTSVYPQGSDTFIRVEITQLEQMGFDIRRFSIRKPKDEALVGGAVRCEFDRTRYLLAGKPVRSFLQIMMTALCHPLRLAAAIALYPFGQVHPPSPPQCGVTAAPFQGVSSWELRGAVALGGYEGSSWPQMPQCAWPVEYKVAAEPGRRSS